MRVNLSLNDDEDNFRDKIITAEEAGQEWQHQIKRKVELHILHINSLILQKNRHFKYYFNHDVDYNVKVRVLAAIKNAGHDAELVMPWFRRDYIEVSINYG